MKHHSTLRRSAAVVAITATVAVLAACTSAANEDGPSASDVAAFKKVLGAPDKASGEPVKIGFTAAEGNTDAVGAQAAADYANDYLGGLGGHPIELSFCGGDTPAAAQACANGFVKDGVVGVTSGTLAQTDPYLKVLTEAKIPFVGALNSASSVLFGEGAFTLDNPLNPIGGGALYAMQHDIDRVALVVIDVPAASGPAGLISAPLYKRADATVDLVAIAPGTADMTPQIQAEEKNKPGLYHVIGDPDFCSSAIRAIKTLGLSAKVSVIDPCISSDGPGSIPGGYGGITVFTSVNLDPAQEETKLYDAVLGTYAEGETDALSAYGYQSVVGLARGVNQSAGFDGSAAAITVAMQNMPQTPLPLGGGATFQCNGQALKGFPAICSVNGYQAVADTGGKLSGFENVDAKLIYTPDD